MNTGRYVGKSDLEETILTHQPRGGEAGRATSSAFRNIGGIIIIDFIDMEKPENREKVSARSRRRCAQDKAQTNILQISELGLVEMTRKRTRESLVQTLCEPCPYCEGKSYVLSEESVAFKVLREIRKAVPHFAGHRIEVTVQRRVAEQLLGPGQASLRALEAELGREIEIRVRPDIHQEQFEIRAEGEGGPVTLELPWLQGKAAALPAEAAELAEAAEALPEVVESVPDVLGETPEGSLDGEEAASFAATPQAVDSEGEFPILPGSEEREER